MRPIDADEVVKHLYWDNDIEAWYLRGKDLDDFPTINPEDLRPKGNWEAYPNDLYLRWSACRMEFYIGHFPLTKKYCPNCSARMEE